VSGDLHTLDLCQQIHLVRFMFQGRCQLWYPDLCVQIPAVSFPGFTSLSGPVSATQGDESGPAYMPRAAVYLVASRVAQLQQRYAVMRERVRRQTQQCREARQRYAEGNPREVVPESMTQQRIL
jgi:hypothetical protein